MPANSTDEIGLLKIFADDAEWNQQKEVSQSYHQQRIAKFEENLNVWFDYSAFCMRNGLSEIGEEGFREIISRNSNHIMGLLAHGTICLSSENYEESRTFFERCLEISPNNSLISTMMVFNCYFLIERVYFVKLSMMILKQKNISALLNQKCQPTIFHKLQNLPFN